MASASAIAIVTPSVVVHRKPLSAPRLHPITLSTRKSSRTRCLTVQASMKENATAVATAAAMAVALAVPEIADAAGPGISPSLKNFLLSIAAGGVVLTVIIGAVIGVSNFDPVKRG